MEFSPDPSSALSFQRKDNGASVTVRYDPSCFPPDPEMMPLLQQLLQGDGDPAKGQRFRDLWRKRVMEILADAGEQSITVVRS